MGTTIESDWENTRLLEELEAARAKIDELRAVSELGHSLFGKQLIENDQLREQLAAEQAKNVGLREALENHSGNYKLSKEECTKINALLDAPSDTSALEAIVKKAGEVMREKCAKEAERDACPAYEYVSDCVPAKGIAEAIRALPAVTLEDLK